MKSKKNYYFLLLLIFLVQLRFFPHPPNFTPVIASGIVMGFFLKNFYISSVCIIFSVFFGDIFFGFHSTMFFVYLALLVPVFLGVITKNFNYLSILLLGFSSSLSFYFITNIGVWITSDMYSHNFSGLLECLILGLPFFSNTLLSTLITLFLLKVLLKFLKVDLNKEYIY
jgi:hypothetical protein